jgi:hypothetical protein
VEIRSIRGVDTLTSAPVDPWSSSVFPTLQAVQGTEVTSRGPPSPRAEGDTRNACRIIGTRSRSNRAQRGCSSAGRAPALHAGGHRFESGHLHQHLVNRIGQRSSRSLVERAMARMGQGEFWILMTAEGCLFNGPSLSPPRKGGIKLREGGGFVGGTTFSPRVKSGRRLDKLLRVRGGCLGTKRRRRTRLPAKSVGELEANDDPAVSEWGNPSGVMSRHSRLNP